MRRSLTLIFISLFTMSCWAGLPSMAPRNPFLADSVNAMPHNDPAQQDSVARKGPMGPTRTLTSADIDYQTVGPAHFGTAISGVYADGHRVMWSNGLDRIVKIDHESYEVLDEYFFDSELSYSGKEAEESIAFFNQDNGSAAAIRRAGQEMAKYRNLSQVYTLLDKDHTYFIGSKEGVISAYSDEKIGDSRSAIVKKAEYRLPAYVTGPMVGINMSYDGWLLVVTEHGYLAAVKRDFSEVKVTRLHFSDGAETKKTGRSGKGWIRNGFAVDDDGGIYLVSQNHMHKVIWDGKDFSQHESDGAWTAQYLNGWGHGSGATPSLMGFGDEDQVVVITDGEAVMNVVLFWRNKIPKDWQTVKGAPSRRIAAMQPVTMDDPTVKAIQSEQSVVVSGYGAMVVNNNPRNAPAGFPTKAHGLLIGFLGSYPDYQPYGVQKFLWNPLTRTMNSQWVNKSISSPSCVPLVSAGSNQVYLIGARDNQWVLEALDWTTGESEFHYVIGDQRYNVLFSGTSIDQQGRIHYGTPWGRVRLNPKS